MLIGSSTVNIGFRLFMPCGDAESVKDYGLIYCSSVYCLRLILLCLEFHPALLFGMLSANLLDTRGKGVALAMTCRQLWNLILQRKYSGIFFLLQKCALHHFKSNPVYVES